MMFRFSTRMALVTAGGFLLLGCRGVRSFTADLSPDAPRLPAERKVPSPHDAGDEDAIEAHAHYGTAVILALSEEIAPALSEFNAAVQKDPGNVSLVMEVSQNFIQAGQLEKAVAVLESVTNRPEASAELFSQLGTICFQLNRPDSAAAACRMAIKKDPRSPNAYAVLFQIYLQTLQLKEAVKLVDGAVKVPQAPPELLAICGELYLRLSTQMLDQKESLNARALEAFQQANRADIKEPEVLLRLAGGFNSLGRLRETVAVYEKLLNDFPELLAVRETVRTKLADTLLRLDERQRAADVLKTMIRDNPTDWRAYYFLGSISYETTNFVQAAEYFSKTILLNPDVEPAYGDLASVQLALDRTSDARTTLDTGRKKFPRSFLLEYLSGITSLRQKNYTNAIQFFTTAEVIAQAGSPNQLRESFYFQFGSAYERLGDLAQAEKAFLKSLEIAPDFDEAQNYLGFMWADHGTNLDRARELIEKALRTDPKNPAYLDSMAWVFFRLNQPQQALDFELKAIVNSKEEDAEIYKHLGDIYGAMGQKEKAREAWQKSLKLEPDEEVQKKLGAESK